jgi:rhodanese-related sulfurtransferase
MARGSDIARIVVLVLLGAAAAAVSNLAASTERKLAWVGSYPRALDVGAPRLEPAPRGTPFPPAAAVSVQPTAPPVAAAAPGSPPVAPVTAAPEPPAPLAPDLAKSFPPHPDKPAIEIAPRDVLLLHGRKALFLDARRSSVYAEGHIPGARSLPVWESDIDTRVKALYEEGLDQRAPIVAYCSGGNCEDSHMLAEKLYMVGFDNVLIYKDGFPDWQKRGLPVNRGANP